MRFMLWIPVRANVKSSGKRAMLSSRAEGEPGTENYE
jgi:hypothetical protein